MSTTIFGGLKEVAEDLFLSERRGRELATKVQLGEAPASAVEEELLGLAEFLDETYSRFKDVLGDMQELGLDPNAVGKLEEVEKAIYVASDVAWNIYREVAEKLFGADRSVNVEVDGQIEKKLDKLEEAVVKLVGKRCRYRISNRLSSILNDLTSCIHRVAEYVSSLKTERRGKCNIVSPSYKGLAFCLTWDKAVRENREYRLYDGHDYDSLEGWVVGDKVYLRVGSAEGHRTLVDLGSGTLEYWDTDEPVNEVMKNLLEMYAGLNCRKHEYGVSCTGVTEDNMKKVALALSMATSMDLRIKDPDRYWDTEYTRIGEEAMALAWLEKLEGRV